MENELCLHGGTRVTRRSATLSTGPDGIEAWIVALAAGFINFIMAGLGRTSSYLFVAVIDIFEVNRRQASLPFTLRSSTRNLLGPAVGILGQKYGVRPVIIVGGIIGTLSAASCFYVNDVLWLTVVWGIINGIGTALTTTLPQVVIGQHFKKHKATASGMAFSGGCVGSFVFSALVEYSLYTYDLGGTFLIIAGIIMHVIPAAIILKPPSWWKTAENEALTSCKIEQSDNCPVLYQENEEKTNGLQFLTANLPQTESNFTESDAIFNSVMPLLHDQNHAKQPTFRCDIDSAFLWQNRHVLIQLLTNNFTVHYEQSDSNCNKMFYTDDDFVKNIELLLRQSENAINGDVKFVKNCTFSDATEYEKKSNGSLNIHLTDENLKSDLLNSDVDAISINSVVYYLEKLFQRDRNDVLQNFSDKKHDIIKHMLEDLEKLHNSLSSYINSIDFSSRFPHDSAVQESSDINKKDSFEQSNTFYTHIKTALRLYKNPLFLLICLCRAVHFITFVPAVTIIVDFSMDKGLSSADGKYVINSLSFGDLLGRLCFGWITDWGYVTLPRYMLYVMFVQGIATIALPQMLSKTALMTCIVAFGLLLGSSFVRHPVLVSCYIDSHDQNIAMGCINFFSGLLGLLVPFYIGYFRDIVGSYDGLFYINGSLCAFIGLLWLFEPYLLKLSSPSHPNKNNKAKCKQLK